MTHPPSLEPPTPPSAAASMLDGYPAIGPGYDEIRAPDGAVRPAWDRLLTGIDQLGAETIRRRWDAAQHVIQENGVTYNVHGDAKGTHRPWALDPIPLIISSEEWAELAPALAQRARLLNALLTDLYGPGRLVRDQQLPSDLIFANPNFLRPCVGLQPAGNRYLTLAAFDLARNPDGRWWVVNDRTQSPTGPGYALENRLVVSRVLPDLFRDCGVSRLAKFFTQLRDTLMAMSPRATSNPRIVLLTPGPTSESYFEHAYLARYLGLTLAEAGDLTVRSHRVYLKNLAGLEQVDVILRRTDDSYCDPLELRGESLVGVPGLVQAAAAGHVAIANALGSGLIETHAIMSFLPKLCQELLDEPLRLPSVATWWCGQPQALAFVLDNMSSLVIKAAFAGDALPVVFGASLSSAQRKKLAAQIREQPHRFVAQESVSLSTAPAWRHDRLQPRHVMLRAYVVAGPDGEYHVMPGGLARVSAEQDSMNVTMQHGGGSKDAWVLADQPVGVFSPVPTRLQPVVVSRSSRELPSRVADGLFWLGRYVERTDNLTQLLRAILIRLTEETSSYGSPELPRLFRALAAAIKLDTDPDFAAHPLDDPSATAGYISARIFDRSQNGALVSCVDGIQQLGSVVRDRISLDAWRVLRSLLRFFDPSDSDRQDPTAMLGSLDDLVVPLSAFAGLTNESMTHAHGWRFLDLGRRVERALAMANAFKHLALDVDDHETLSLHALLFIGSSEMTYRSRYRAHVAAGPVIDLLMLDEDNPRGIAFQLARIQTHLRALPPNAAAPGDSDELKLIASLRDELQAADVDALALADATNLRPRLGGLLETLEAQLPAFSDLLVQHYLAHTLSPHSLLPQNPDPGIEQEETL